MSNMIGASGIERQETLALGCFASLCSDRLSEPLLAFTDRHPEVVVGVHELAHAALLPAVRSGILGLAISPHEPVDDLASAALWIEEIVLLAASDHAIMRAIHLTPERLRRELFLTTSNELDRYMLVRIFGSSRPAVRAVASEQTVRAAVVRGEGVALARAGACTELDDGIAIIPIASSLANLVVRGFWLDEAARHAPLRQAVALVRRYAKRKPAGERALIAPGDSFVAD